MCGEELLTRRVKMGLSYFSVGVRLAETRQRVAYLCRKYLFESPLEMINI